MKNIKKIKSRIWINKFEIEFEYDTKRGNHRKQKRAVFQTDENAAKRDFIIWLDTMREKEPHRAMLNANILSVANVGGELIEL